MPIDYTHIHTSRQIMDADAVKTPIDPSGGGGSISATDGTTTVNPATSIQFPVGTLEDLGAGVAGVGLLLRQAKGSVNFDDFPGNNQAIDLGAAFDLSPDDTVIRCFAIVTDDFPNDVALSIAIVPANDLSNDYQLMKYPNTGTGSGNLVNNANPLDGSGTNVEPIYVGGLGSTPAGRVGRADGPCKVVCYLGWSSPPATGAADIYAIIATPAS